MRFTATLLALICTISSARASGPASDRKPPALQRIVIEPEGDLHLVGAAARQQLLVTGQFDAGSMRDLTSSALLSTSAPALRIDGSVVRALKDGAGTLVARIDGLSAERRVIVRATEKPQPFSFQNDVMAIFSRAGCNMGTCHGNFNGKNGFRLSLRGENAAFDIDSLARDTHGRRINRLSPDDSLLLLKASGQLAHDGGVRFAAESSEYLLLRRWIAEGAKPDPPETLSVQELAVWPRERYLLHGADKQQLAVRGRFSDGVWRDLTHLAVFEPSSDLVNVTPAGLVSANRPGEATVLVRYLDQRAPVRLAFVPARPDFHWPSPPANNFIDKLVYQRLESLQVEPSELADDSTFLRRVYLDVC